MKTVAIVEDNTAVRVLLEDWLKMEGYNAVGFPDGENLHSIEAVKPDLIILDLILPGKSGLEVLRELRKHHGFEGIPAMLLSASLNLRSLQEEGVVTLEKPFDIEELSSKVSTLLSQK